MLYTSAKACPLSKCKKYATLCHMTSNSQPTIYLASDHGGFALKTRLAEFLTTKLGYKVEDLGPASYNKTDDYPDFAHKLTTEVLKTKQLGILICTSGIGMCLSANKIKGIRAGIGFNLAVAKSMKNDNNTNVLCLPAKHLTEDHALAIAKTWLATPFSGDERHVRRLGKIE